MLLILQGHTIRVREKCYSFCILMIIENKNYDYASNVLILLIGILVVLKSHQLTKPYKYLWVILVLLFNLLGIIAFLIWKQYLNKMSNSGSHGNV